MTMSRAYVKPKMKNNMLPEVYIDPHIKVTYPCVFCYSFFDYNQILFDQMK